LKTQKSKIGYVNNDKEELIKDGKEYRRINTIDVTRGSKKE